MKKALYLFLTIFLGNTVNAMEQSNSPLMSLPTEIITIIASNLIDEKKLGNPENCADLDKSIKDLNNAKLVCKEFNDIINMVINHKFDQKFSLKENYLLKKMLIKNFDYSNDQLTFMDDDSKSTKEIINTILAIKNSNGATTPLHWASFNGSLAVVKLLLENGAVIDVQDYCGWTPLHGASNNGNTEVVKLLLENGAPIDVQDYCGRTPLHCALSNSFAKVVKLLEKAAEQKKIKEENAKDQYNDAINVLSQKSDTVPNKALNSF
ncbi:MAG: ankyrin repeat domain-containing protein [Candidatus Babeliales bacterium]